MIDGLGSLDGLGVAGAGLVVMAAVRRAVEARRGPLWPWAIVAVGGAAACLAQGVWLLAGGWLAASVAAARAPADDRAAALGTLGDAVAVAGFAAAAVDSASTGLPWAGAAGMPVPAWLVGMVAVGLALRTLAAGRDAPALVVVGAVVALRLGAGDLTTDQLDALVVLGPVAVLASWSGSAAAAPVLLGAAAWGVGHETATVAAAVFFAGGAIVAAAAGTDAAAQRDLVGPGALADFRDWFGRGAPRGGALPAGALLVALPVLGQSPVAQRPGATVVLGSAVLAAAICAAGIAPAGVPGAARLRSRRARARRLTGVAAATAAGLLLVALVAAPGVWTDLVGGMATDAAAVLGRTRAGLAWGAAVAVPVTAALLWGGGRSSPPTSSRPRAAP